MSAGANQGPTRFPTAIVDSRRCSRNCAASRLLVLGETPYCSTRVRRKFPLIRSAVGDGAIEALGEGRASQDRGLEQDPEEIGRAIVRQRGCAGELKC